MRQANQMGGLGALFLAISLVGYAIYELVLYPNAGFPTNDYAVVVAGVETLRVGHVLKFGYALGIALLMVGLSARLEENAPMLARLSAVFGVCAVALFLASGSLGLLILQTAQATFDSDPTQAITTILLRTVTIALLAAGTTAVGAYGLFIGLAGVQTGVLPRSISLLGIGLGILHLLNLILPDPLNLVAPLATIVWAGWLSVLLGLRQVREVKAIKTG